MSDLVILINKGPIGSMFNVHSFKPKNRMLEFNHQSFKFVRCSKNDVRVRSMFDKMVFDPSLAMIELLFSTHRKNAKGRRHHSGP